MENEALQIILSGAVKEFLMVQYLQKISGAVHLAVGDPALGFAPVL
jgi:hypothetical protein